jgi:class 3 adenylate cyclase
VNERLCAFVLLVGAPVLPSREELHWRLHDAVERAAARAGIAFPEVQLQMLGDGALVVFPADVNEPRAFAALCRVFRSGLPPADQAPVRIRLAVAFGPPETATLEVTRLVDGADPGVALHVLLGREGLGA